jgi:hypothetical protein
MEILEENTTNWLVMTPDGSTETKTKSSPLNQLLYGHNLWGLLDTGDEIWTHKGKEDEPTVTIIPGENDCYTIRLGNAPDLTIGAHHKTDLIDALIEMYQEGDGESVQPITALYDSIRRDMLRADLLDAFSKAFAGKVEVRDDGWFINGHLLLNYEGEFYHPETDSRQRSGRSVIGVNSASEAYRLQVESPEEMMSREITIDGETRRLTPKEMKFLSKAIWAVEKTPDRT